MKKLFTLVLLLLSTLIYCQELNYKKEQILGKWKVVKVVNGSNNKHITEFSNSFMNSEFDFQKENKITVQKLKDTKGKEAFYSMINSSNWIFLEKTGIIKIGHESNKYSIMTIKLSLKEDKTYFIFAESDLMLEVIKI